MGHPLWTLVRFLHVLAAACWVGGMITLGAVAVPAARGAGDPAARRRVLTAAGRGFGALGALALLTLVVTGLALVHHEGIALGELAGSDYGRRILAKMGLVAAMVVLALVHALWQGPRARRAEAAGDARAGRWRVFGLVLDGLLLVAALAALWLAVSLVG